MRSGFAAAVAVGALGLWLAVGAVTPTPAEVSKGCGTITSTSIYPRAKVVAIRGVGCKKARRVARRFDHEGKQTPPWRCGLAHDDLPRLFSCGWGGDGGSLQSRDHALKAIGVGNARGARATASKTKTKTFSSGTINRAIPDADFVSFEIAPSILIKRRGKVKDVNYAVRISHPDIRDLDIGASHIAPGGGQFISLKEHEFLSDPQGADFGAGAPGCEGALFTVFDSQATTPISQGTAPFVGSFVPAMPLTIFNGMQLRGRWYVDLLDTNPGDAGVINCWQVTIKYKPAKKKN